jgi:hypothetical protein
LSLEHFPDVTGNFWQSLSGTFGNRRSINWRRRPKGAWCPVLQEGSERQPAKQAVSCLSPLDAAVTSAVWICPATHPTEISIDLARQHRQARRDVPPPRVAPISLVPTCCYRPATGERRPMPLTAARPHADGPRVPRSPPVSHGGEGRDGIILPHTVDEQGGGWRKRQCDIGVPTVASTALTRMGFGLRTMPSRSSLSFWTGPWTSTTVPGRKPYFSAMSF